MYANSPNKEAAWKFIQFLTREDVNGKVVDLIPANVKAADAFLKANRKGPDRIMEQLNNAAPRPLSPRYLEVSDIEVTLAQDVFAGMDPKAAAEKACAAIDALRLRRERRRPTTAADRRGSRSPGPLVRDLWQSERVMHEAQPMAGLGLPRPGDDPGRGADVLPDDRHGHRKLLLDLLHQPQSAIRRAGSSTGRSSRAASSARSSGTRASGRCSSSSSRTCLGFAVALLLNQRLPTSGLMRSLVLLPWILPGVVAAILWRFMYDPQLGLINSFLIRLGLADQGVAWLAESVDRDGRGDRRRGLEGLSVLDGGLSRRAAERRPASRSRRRPSTAPGRSAGCSAWCIPSMREVIVINIVLTTILTFNYFDMIWVLTRGGPQNATHIFPTKIYELGFGQFRFGEAAAYGVFSILVLAVLIALYFVAPAFRRRQGRRAA